MLLSMKTNNDSIDTERTEDLYLHHASIDKEIIVLIYSLPK